MNLTDINPVDFIFDRAATARKFYVEFMGQCSLVADNIVVCRTKKSIESAEQMGGTKLPDDKPKTKLPNNA